MSIQKVTLSEPLNLELGGILSNPTVAYSTYGTLNSQKNNVILVCHALTANSEVDDWWAGIYGSGKILDPEKYFILCTNNLGSPYGSTSPKSKNGNEIRYGLDFPVYTIRDVAQLQVKFLKHLGIEHIQLIIGGSCGGNIAQEIAFELGHKVNHMVIMCCSASESPWVVAIHESQRIVLSSDPSFYKNDDNAAKSGLKGARAFALPFYRSHPAFLIRQREDDDDQVENFKAASYIRYQGEKFVGRYDAHCYYTQLNALDTHNIGRHRGGTANALKEIKAKTLSIGFSSDLLIPTTELKQLVNHIENSSYVEIETPFGHDAFLIETDKINEEVLAWRWG